jgi:hypothetical protein
MEGIGERSGESLPAQSAPTFLQEPRLPPGRRGQASTVRPEHFGSARPERSRRARRGGVEGRRPGSVEGRGARRGPAAETHSTLPIVRRR